jgi:predicted dehydrogenase
MNHRATGISRRRFVAGSAALAFGISAPRSLSASSRIVASDKLNIGIIGAGGRGADNLAAVRHENIVALCDCDFRNAAESFERFPNAKRYQDWRKMLDAEKNLDAVVVSTPDHNHAIISISAMRLGKHVYCEKPLTRSVWEARRMAQVAAETKVATQMGTQGHAFDGSRRAVEVIRSGAIGEVRELHVWTDRPAGWWPQGIERPRNEPDIPEGLDWDVWLGPAPNRPYHPAYVPFKWRGFWDFGTGAIGDMGIHNFDTVHWALELGVPTSVEVKDCSPRMDSGPMKETAPLWSIIELNFPARAQRPPIKMTWYDGGKVPPVELFHGEPIPKADGGSLAIGTKGTLMTRTWHGGHSPDDMFQLLPRKTFADYQAPEPSLRREPHQDHHAEWIAACKGGPQSLSNFGYASTLTESLLLGNVALRTGRKIVWDAENMRAQGCPEADRYIRPEFRNGWTI